MSIFSALTEEPCNPLEHNLDLDQRIERFKQNKLKDNEAYIYEGYVPPKPTVEPDNEFLLKLQSMALKYSFKSYLWSLSSLLILGIAISFGIYYQLYL